MDYAVDDRGHLSERYRLKAKNQKNKPLLPDIFKEQGENDVSVDSGVLINDDGSNSEIIDGAKISIKVKTD